MNCQEQAGAQSGGPEACVPLPLPDPALTGGRRRREEEPGLQALELALPGAASH